MKELIIGFVLLNSLTVMAQVQRQQPSNCPAGTVSDVYTVIATDSSGNVVSNNFQSYCRQIQQQQPSNCPEGTIADVYTEIARDGRGNVISTRFQSYCKEVE